MNFLRKKNKTNLFLLQYIILPYCHITILSYHWYFLSLFEFLYKNINCGRQIYISPILNNMDQKKYDVAVVPRMQKLQPDLCFKDINVNFKNILVPPKNLASYRIKNCDEDFLYFNFYKDNNKDQKKKIIKVLKDISGSYNNIQLFQKIKKLSKTYRYFIKTDLIGAYYNLKMGFVYNTILSRIPNRDVKDYLIGFYDYIKDNYETYSYLYITEYSEYIFYMFLKDIIKEKNILFRIDDILIYDNNKEVITEKLKDLSNALNIYSLYINIPKTYYIDTVYDSIYVFKTIVTTPSCGILDNKIKNKIRELIEKNEIINVYEMEEDLYTYFNLLEKKLQNSSIVPTPHINVKYIKNMPLYKTLMYNLLNYIYRSTTIDNNLIYNPVNISSNICNISKASPCKNYG
ncbi:hypothetical protein Yalta_167 [Yalta virus]|nr:hypothetical protein Yalta_167 [Yalta virus]